MDFRLREMGDKIKDVDMLAEGRDLVVVEVANRNQCLEQLISTSVWRIEVWERDINITYFHVCVKNRGMRNSILDSGITLVVSSVEANESPRADESNFAFFIGFWNMIKVEVEVMFQQFYTPATLLKIFSSYFVTLWSLRLNIPSF